MFQIPKFKLQVTSYKFRVKGFTLLETLIVVAVTATLAVAGIGYYMNASRVRLLDRTAQEIVSYLKFAQQNSVSQKDNDQWGVHFENPSQGRDFYALYKGTTYSSPLEVRYLPEGIEFVSPSTGSSVDIPFNRITGFLSSYLDKQIILKDINLNQTTNIIVCSGGLITTNIEIAYCGNVVTTTSLPPKIAFVTRDVFKGNLGGLSGADSICQSKAQNAGLPGTFKAWLSDMNVSAADRLTHWNGPYVTPEGADIIAYNWNDLIDGSLEFPINQDEFTNTVEDGEVWTATFYNGSKNFQSTCNNWTSSEDYERGGSGLIGTTTEAWTDYEREASCYENRHLYCIQQ